MQIFKQCLVKISALFFTVLLGFVAPLVAQTVENGVINLRPYHFHNHEFQLNGAWKFYLQEFVQKKDISDHKFQTTPTLVVPMNWEQQKYGQVVLPSHTYGTYHCKAIFPEKLVGTEITFKTMTFSAAGTLIVEDSILKIYGNPTTTPEGFKAGLEPGILTYRLPNDTINIFFQISNFTLKEAGFENPLKVGTRQFMEKRYYDSLKVQFFLAGAIFIMTLFYLGFYFLQRQDKSSLYFSMFLLVLLLRTFFSGEYVINQIVSINAVWLRKIEFFSFYFAIFPFILTLKAVFNNYFAGWFVKVVGIISVGASLLVLFFPESVYSYSLFSYQLFTLFIGLVVLYWLVYLSLKKVNGAFVFLLSFIVLLVAVVIDILSAMSILHTEFILHYGLFGFIFFQSFAMASVFSSAFKKVSHLSEELNIANQTLEAKVAQRTNDLSELNKNLQERNVEVSQQNAEIAAQRDEVERQRELAEEQRDLAESQNKKITDSINYASKIQNAVFPSMDNFKRAFPESYIFFRPRVVVSGDFYYFRETDDFYFLAAADCTGHGVPGAFMSLLGVSFLNEIVASNKTVQPNQVLDALREKLIKAINQDNKVTATDGIDIAMVSIHKQTKQMCFAGAYNNLIHIRAQQTTILKADRMPIGVHRKSHVPFNKQEIQLQKGDQIMLFSDGFIDQLGGRHFRKYTSNRFYKFVERVGNLPLDEQYFQLDHELDTWKGDVQQNDDILILSVKI